MARVLIVGTLDTKGREIEYLRRVIEAQGVEVVVVDVGMRGEPLTTPTISREEVAKAAGSSLEEVASIRHEGLASEVMARGLTKLVTEMYENKGFDGIIAVGGSMGTAIVTAAMRALPYGLPKVMVSTMASRDVREYVGFKDIMMVSPVTDLLGLNEVNMKVLYNAGVAVASMAKSRAPMPPHRPTVGVTLLGTLTDVVDRLRASLESEGFQVMAFHAVGSGGRAFEDLVEKGVVDAGVIDLAPKELVDYLLGGWLDAGPHRLEAAGRRGLPQVVSLGCMDYVVFSPPTAVPRKFKGRPTHQHNPVVIEVRTSAEELRRVGRLMAKKLNKARGPTSVVVPLKGFSPRDREGGVFYDPEADAALVEELKRRLRPKVRFVEVDAHINDPSFTQALLEEFHELLRLAKAR